MAQSPDVHFKRIVGDLVAQLSAQLALATAENEALREALAAAQKPSPPTDVPPQP